ncbi:MAG: C25 family cysteine peptidase, partial [Thermoanaerobaculia bacterium]
PPAVEPMTAFKIQVEESGAYRVAFEDLDLGERRPASSGIGMVNAGEPVLVWIEDGGDGVFGPGDWLEFVGEHLRGENSHFDEFSRFNVYFLGFDHPNPARWRPADAGLAGLAEHSPEGPFRALRTRHHLEQDLVRLRLPPPRDGSVAELWYWVKLSHIAEEPHVEILDLTDLDQRPGATVDLKIHFRGWSTPRNKAVVEAGDHRVEVSIDGTAVGAAEWNGIDPYLLEISGLPADRLVAGENRIEFRVPIRKVAQDDRPLIDVLMLNWIEVELPLAGHVEDWQERLELTDPDAGLALRLESDPGRELLLYGDGGSRIAVTARRRDDGGGEAIVPVPAGERAFLATAADRLRSPASIVRDRPSRLADTANQADYLMIAHRRLLAATEPLAELHRARGLTVEVIDVEDVFDEFGHGIQRPQALRAFLDHAYHRWQAPRPRFVLLVGDASWDARNELVEEGNYPALSFRRRDARSLNRVPSTPYAEDAHLNRRGLIPTWTQADSQGQAASDNYFVAVDGDDVLPDMAIGRLPVVEAAEVSAIVDKTIRYVTAPEVGPWRRNALFIANESRSFQNKSDNLARKLSAAGFLPQRIYPASRETSNEHHSRRLIEAFDEGQLLVHFYGHGGRYIWRTGPPDLKKNHDLFTLEHLDQLQPGGRLPVVLSMTCYSAPFDHPNADSIGEKLLRIADRGAIAVLAASWRNSPSASWGQATLEELTTPGATIGEAIQRAKHRITHRSFVETYNLLGDPAVPVALPAAEITVAVAVAENGPWSVSGTIDLEDFDGRLKVELVGAEGHVYQSVDLEPRGNTFAVELPPAPTAKRILAYAWDDSRQHDAFGALELTADNTVVSSEAPARRSRSR